MLCHGPTPTALGAPKCLCPASSSHVDLPTPLTPNRRWFAVLERQVCFPSGGDGSTCSWPLEQLFCRKGHSLHHRQHSTLSPGHARAARWDSQQWSGHQRSLLGLKAKAHVASRMKSPKAQAPACPGKATSCSRSWQEALETHPALV